METLAKIGGYVAPSLGALVIISILLECCRPVPGGKCLPTLLLLGCVVCQGLTFFLFQSELFCARSETIDMCVMDQAAYRSVQATIWYFVSFILYLCGGTPRPVLSMMKPNQQVQQQGNEGGGYSNKNGSNSNKIKSKSKKMTGDYNREDYERRRKEKRMKGRGVSGRSKQQIYQDIGDDGKKSSSSKKKRSHSSSGRSGGRRSSRDNSNNHNNSSSTALVLRDRSKERTSYDDYVDTEPDGMDWSAYDPKERDEYYDRKRWKKNQQQSPSPSSQPRRGGENYRDRDYYDEEEQHYLRNGDEYSDYSRGGDEYDRNDSMYSDRSGYLGTVYDDSRYSRENSRGSSRHDSYRSGGRSPRDHYDDNDDGYVDDDYTKDVDSYGEPYDDQDSRRGDDGYNDSYYSKRASNDSSRYAEREPGSRGASNGGYDEASYNDESYVDSFGEGGDYQDGRRRDDDYYDGPPLT